MFLGAVALSASVSSAAHAATACESYQSDLPFQNLVDLSYEYSALDGIVHFGSRVATPGCSVTQYNLSGIIDTATNSGTAVFEELTGGFAKIFYDASISRGTVSDVYDTASGQKELSQSTPFDLRLDSLGGGGDGNFFPGGLTLSSTFGDAFFDEFTSDYDTFFEPDRDGGSDERLTRLVAFNWMTIERNAPLRVAVDVPASVPVPAAGIGLVTMLGMLLAGTRRRRG